MSAVAFLFTACQKEEATLDPSKASESGFYKNADDCATTFTTPMIAGGGKYDENCTGYNVGTITVNRTDNGDGTCTYDVTYDITAAGWVIDQTHLYIGPEGLIPLNDKGNPQIGHFEFNVEHDPPVLTYNESKTIACGADNVIAAHAEVRTGTADYPGGELCEALPETATLVAVSGEPVSYINATISDAGWLNGVYEGWCIDEEHGLATNVVYAGSKVYCTINGDADPLVHEPENFDNLNWLINQDFVGKISSCDGSPFTVMDVQYAVWYLMDDYVPPISEQNCRQTELEQLALTEGEGFMPECGDLVAVALNPSYIDGNGLLIERQRIIISIPYPCDETAWGYGYEEGVGCTLNSPYAEGKTFEGSNWGWYFYGCQAIQ